jgi:hypothetical protein
MRAIAAFVLLGLVATRPAAAEPQASPATERANEPQKKKPKARTPKAGQEKPAEPAAAPRAGFGLGSMAAMAASAAAGPAAEDVKKGKVEARRLDLTPERQVEKLAGDRRGSERGSGVTLGDDTSWRVQAVQVGAMAAVFGALVAICGNGQCLLPEVFGGGRDELGPAPGVGTPSEPKLRDPR